MHDDVPGLLALAHHVEDHVALGDLKVSVDLHAALVGVGGHGVPDAARLQDGHAHGQLAGLQHGGVNELVDGALVAGLHGAQGPLGSVGQFDQPGLVGAVGGGGNHVELGRALAAVAFEGHDPGAPGDVQAVLVAHGVDGAVHGNLARAADIEHTQLPALQEILGSEIGPDVNALVQGHHLIYGHTAQGDHPVHMAVNGHHLVGAVQVLDQELVAQLLSGVALHVALVGRVPNVHSNFSFVVF